METIIKQTREVGTSAGVLLPRSWLNKQVVVTLFSPSKQEIAKDVLEILIRKNLNKEIKGIYLFGSYARKEQTSESDIDILVITKDTNKIVVHQNYQILLVSEKKLSEKSQNDLLYITILKEADTILNKELIEKYSKNIKPNLKKILPEIKNIIKINKETIELCKKHKKKVPDGIVYSVVLRLRELYLIKCLIKNKLWSNKEFSEICGEKPYKAYIRVKTNLKETNNNLPDEIKPLIHLSEKWLKELRE
jgi:predicted nucleotidyltransferase